MERKQELTSVDLAAVVREFGSYAGAKVDKAYLYDDDLLRLKLRDFDRGRVELLIEVGDVKRAHVATPEHVPDAPGRPPNFAMMLRNRLSGADFVGVEQYEFDRILTFHFERPDGNTTVVAELFGDGNVAVLDGDRVVVDALETVRLKSRTVVPGATYEFPSSRVNPLTLGYDEFVARMTDSDSDVVRTLATRLNFGGRYGEELCVRAGVEKTKPIVDATDDDFKALFDAVERLATAVADGAFDPCLYYDGDKPIDVTPFPHVDYESTGYRVVRVDTFNGALDRYFHENAESGEEPERGSTRPDFEAQIAKQERIIAQQEGAIESFDEQADAERERAQLLYARYGLVDDVLSTVRDARDAGVSWADIEETIHSGAADGNEVAEAVRDFDGSTGTVTLDIEGTRVSVDVSVGVEKNADRLFQEAKRIEEKKAGALDAIEDTRAELAAIEQRRDAWSAEPIEDEPDEDVDWLTEPSIPVRQPKEWYERFRWFRTSDDFLVIGGRNADQNEELVKKYMDRGDKFFHTQAPGAPATILKATGPSEPAKEIDFPEQTLSEAAQFAVSYSTVWKDGHFGGDVYMVDPEQVSKTPESGEFVEKGSFVIRGDRTYFDDTPVGVAVGIQCEPATRVVGGPPSAIDGQAELAVRVEPGRFAQGDVAKRIYRVFRESFADTSFVRKIASPDRIQHFLPPGGSRIVEE